MDSSCEVLETETLALPETDDVLDAAIRYLELGFAPIFTDGKIPVGMTDWQTKVLDENDIRAWYQRVKSKNPNVGIAPRQWRGKWLIAIDVDSAERLQYLESKLCQLPKTLTGRSARGIRAFYTLPVDYDAQGLRNITYLRLPGEVRPPGKVEGVDVKTQGGQVVVFPSRHETGIQYSWLDSRIPVDLPPEWISIVLAPVDDGETRSRQERRAYDTAAKYSPKDFHTHAREFRSVSRYFDAALKNQIRTVIESGEGTRNESLNKAAFSLFVLLYGLKLDEQQLAFVRSELLRAAVSTGLSEQESRATIESARKAGFIKQRAPHLREIDGEHQPAEADVPGADDVRADYAADSREDDGLYRFHGDAIIDADNIAHVLRTAPEFCGGPRYNEFGGQIIWRELPECIRVVRSGRTSLEYQDADAVALGGALTRLKRYGWEGPIKGKDVVHDGVIRAAYQQPCNTLHEFVASLPPWDGVPRAETMFPTYFGAEDNEANRLIGRAFMSLMFARALSVDPIEVDGTLLLYGPEGCGKDTFYRELFGREWYTEPRGKLTDKDVLEALSNSWVAHDAEMAALKATVQRADPRDPLAAVKAILTASHDDVRPAYGRSTVRLRRRAVIVLSTNSHELLEHGEGGRRFWPVTVVELDREALLRDRLQLLAEGVALFRGGEPWWIPAGRLALQEAREDFRGEEDPWAPLVWQAVSDLAHEYPSTTSLGGGEYRVCTNEILARIELDPSRRGKDGKRRIAVILHAEGWRRVRAKVACRPGVYSKSTYFRGKGNDMGQTNKSE